MVEISSRQKCIPKNPKKPASPQLAGFVVWLCKPEMRVWLYERAANKVQRVDAPDASIIFGQLLNIPKLLLPPLKIKHPVQRRNSTNNKITQLLSSRPALRAISASKRSKIMKTSNKLQVFNAYTRHNSGRSLGPH